jgi:hypothetical protein
VVVERSRVDLLAAGGLDELLRLLRVHSDTAALAALTTCLANLTRHRTRPLYLRFPVCSCLLRPPSVLRWILSLLLMRATAGVLNATQAREAIDAVMTAVQRADSTEALAGPCCRVLVNLRVRHGTWL